MKKRPSKNPFAKLSNTELKAAFREDWSMPEFSDYRLELLIRDHPLDKKYYRYFEPNPIVGGILKHPLLVTHCHPAQTLFVEWLIEKKELQLQELIAKRKWLQAVFLHDIPFLLYAFERYMENFDDKTYWRILAMVWTHQESVWSKRKLYLEWFLAKRDHRNCLMSAAERRKLASLPNQLTIYRGFIGNRGVKCMSWTLDRNKAVWFAQRYSVLTELGAPKLAEATVRKRDILAYFNGRKEKEVVVDSSKLLDAHATKIDPAPTDDE